MLGSFVSSNVDVHLPE
jgi:hypothetical protein